MAKTKQLTKADWIAKLNSEPNPEHIRKNEDGSTYLPISITQDLLDELLYPWDYIQTRETYGRKWARGGGYIVGTDPFGNKVTRYGDAGILLTGNVRTDSPRLQSMILLSAAKKFGKVFGRDLNRNKDDAPLPVIKEEKVPMNEEKDRLQKLIEQSDTIIQLETFSLLAKSKGLLTIYNKQHKKLSHDNSKLG